MGGMRHISVTGNTKLDSDAGKALIDRLRAGDKTAVDGLTFQGGGLQAVYQDFDRYLYSNFPKAIIFIVCATFVLLLLLFRSLLLPLNATLMHVLSVSAAYGVLVFVFHWGNFANLLNFTINAFSDTLVPILF